MFVSAVPSVLMIVLIVCAVPGADPGGPVQSDGEGTGIMRVLQRC